MTIDLPRASMAMSPLKFWRSADWLTIATPMSFRSAGWSKTSAETSLCSLARISCALTACPATTTRFGEGKWSSASISIEVFRRSRHPTMLPSGARLEAQSSLGSNDGAHYRRLSTTKFPIAPAAIRTAVPRKTARMPTWPPMKPPPIGPSTCPAYCADTE
jgi:hypothetical protein